MLNFEPYNPSADGSFEKYVLVKELPSIGSIVGLIEVEGDFDLSWAGKENCVFYKDGIITFETSANYALERLKAYPTIQQQLDMQYWDSVNGTTTWADAIAAVKAQYPKP